MVFHPDVLRARADEHIDALRKDAKKQHADTQRSVLESATLTTSRSIQQNLALLKRLRARKQPTPQPTCSS